MFNKLSGKFLIIAVILLLGIYLFSTFFGVGSNKRTFPDQLLVLDSANVVAISINALAEGHNPFRLEKKGDEWRVIRDGKDYEVEKGKVERVLQEFKLLKPERMAGKNEKSWQKYEVNDSLGTAVLFELANGETHSLVVGKFTFDQAKRNGTSFVRLNDEEETYAVDGFLSMSVNLSLNSWRNKLLLQGTKDSWSELKYTFPADSGYVLTLTGTGWQIDDQPADSARVIEFLNSLNLVQSVNFVDDVQVGQTPDLSLRLTPIGLGEVVTIEAFEVSDEHGYLIRSSLNPNSYFSNAQSQLMDKLFFRAALFQTTIEE